MEKKLEQQRKELLGDWTPESGISKTDAFFNKLFKDIEEGKFPTKNSSELIQKSAKDIGLKAKKLKNVA